MCKYVEFELNTRHKEGYDIPYLYVANLFCTGKNVIWWDLELTFQKENM